MSDDLAWLAGIIDGEGAVAITRHVDGDSIHYSTYIDIGMSHQETLKRVASILESIGITDVLARRQAPQSINNQVMFGVRVTRLSAIRTLCEAVLPLSTTKQKHLTEMLHYVERRLDGVTLNEEGRIAAGPGYRKPYTEDDARSYATLKRLNSRGSERDPINSIEWIHARKLTANSYNANVVFTPELRLLEHSILEQGWIQPILASPKLQIIDGFHRWRLSLDSDAIKQRYAEEVPVAIVRLEEPDAMMLTVRINRAKGDHVAVRLSDIVQQLHNDLGCTVEEIMKGCGMGKNEVELLLAGTLLKARNLESYKYSKAWVPIETRHAEKAAAEEFEREA